MSLEEDEDSVFMLLNTNFILSFSLSLLQRYMLSADQEHEQLFDLIQQLLIYEPRKRLSAADALKHPFFAPLTRNTHSVQSKRSLSSQSSSSSETE